MSGYFDQSARSIEIRCMVNIETIPAYPLQVHLDFYNNMEEIDVTDYVASNEWAIVDHPAKKNLKYYPCCEEPYPDLTFTLHIKRMENFYTQVFIVPGVVLSLLAPVMFALPAAGPHRYVLGM